jgi:uncharacterized caspase-like protein
MRSILVALLPALLLAVLPQPGTAAERALTIGNGAYGSLERLDSAKNDAQRVAEILKKIGFQVALATDATNGAMRAAVQSFAEGLSAGDTAVVYFSGHVFQSQGRNYLLPVTANLRSEIDLTTQAVALNAILAVLQRQPLRVGLVILDGAYKTQFVEANRMKPGIAAFGLEVRNFVVFLAAPPDEAVPIRPGPSSVFGRALLTQLSQEKVVVDAVVAQVTDSVVRATGGAQRPWSSSTLPAATPLQESPGMKTVAGGKPDTASSPGPTLPAATPAPAPVPPPAAAAPVVTYGLQELITFDGTLAREERMKIQRRLQEMGFYNDEIDGVFGTQTRQAIRAYQESKGAPRTGYVTPDELNDLL